ncbi:MAG: hypothetical protein O3B01_09275 [Planctomycetota bacterium]|nr:hypothetical protein [Planctomycetota bacterium]
MKSSAVFFLVALPLLNGQESMVDIQLLERLQEIQARAEELHQEGEKTFGEFCLGPSAAEREKLTENIRQLELKLDDTSDAMLNKAQLVRARLQRLNAARESAPAKNLDKLVEEYERLKQQADEEYGRHLLDRHQLVESARVLTHAEAEAVRRLSDLQKRYAAVPVPGTAIGKLKHQAVQDLIEEAKDSLRVLRREKSSLAGIASGMSRGNKGIAGVKETVERGMQIVRLLEAHQTDLLLWQYCMKLGSPQVILGVARGDVFIKNGNDDIPVKSGETCAPGSQITTGKGAYCWLYLPETRLVEVGADSIVQLPGAAGDHVTVLRGSSRIIGVTDISAPPMTETIRSAGDVVVSINGPQLRFEVGRHTTLSGAKASSFKKSDSPAVWVVNAESSKSEPGFPMHLAALRRQLRGMPFELSEEPRPTLAEEPGTNLANSGGRPDTAAPGTKPDEGTPKKDVAPSFAPE